LFYFKKPAFKGMVTDYNRSIIKTIETQKGTRNKESF